MDGKLVGLTGLRANGRSRRRENKSAARENQEEGLDDDEASRTMK